MSDSNGYILPTSFASFAQMSADLVRYYNAGGFTDAGNFFQSPTPYPVTWWGIFNEPNGNGLTSQQYVDLYNTVVPAMAQVDPSIKFLAVELSDYGTQAESYLPAFVSGVTAPVDVLATHFYSTCDQTDTDAQVFSTVPGFVSEVQDIYSQLATNPNLAGVPVWVTENNVNADYDLSNGMSACNPNQTFVLDPRGSSPFFAAWRSLVFASLGETGAQALYHWDFGDDQQFGEVDSSANPYFSYWVDYYLSHWLPSPPGQDILQVTATGCCLWIYDGGNPLGLDTHTLAARNLDGSVVILMSNHAVAKPTDNNGPGTVRNFALDLSALGAFTSATLVTPGRYHAAEWSCARAIDPLRPDAGRPCKVTARCCCASPMRRRRCRRRAWPMPLATHRARSRRAKSCRYLALRSAPPFPHFSRLPIRCWWPIRWQGVHVLFDGVPAPVLYASAGQVNVVVPYEVAGESTTQVQVEYLGALSPPVSLPVAATAPGIFTLNASGAGPGAILNAADESVNSAANPAAPGDWVSIFATGAGATTPAGVDGLLATGPSGTPNANVSVNIGGLPCQLNYKGAAPGLVSGVVQINAQVPAGVTSGPSVPVQVFFGTASSQSGVTLAVQ